MFTFWCIAAMVCSKAICGVTAAPDDLILANTAEAFRISPGLLIGVLLLLVSTETAVRKIKRYR